MKLNSALHNFLLEQELKGNSLETIEYYRKRIGYFVSYCNNKKIEDLTIEDYNKYALYLIKKKKLSSYTIKTSLNAVKIFIRYICKKYLNNEMYKDIKPYKCDKKTIVVLTNEQIEQILNYFDESYLGRRNILIVALMLDAGLRVSEVCNLEFDDFIVERRLIRVFGKGHKERLVPMSDSIFQYYSQFYYMHKTKKGYLFEENGKKIKPNGVGQMIRKIKKALHFSKLHPHYLRHTFATLFLLNGGDPLHLQLILGHTTLYMTEQYIHIATEMTLFKQSKYSPLSNMKKIPLSGCPG